MLNYITLCVSHFPILQNIAAGYPRLSGHLRPHVACTVGLRWFASSWPSILLSFSSFTRGKLASLTERRACVVRGPTASDRSTFRLWYRMEERGERRGGILVVLPVVRGKIDISRTISSFPFPGRAFVADGEAPPYGVLHRRFPARTSWSSRVCLLAGERAGMMETPTYFFSFPTSLSHAAPASPQTLAAAAAGPSPPGSYLPRVPRPSRRSFR
jgi:hypothetical protein